VVSDIDSGGVVKQGSCCTAYLWYDAFVGLGICCTVCLLYCVIGILYTVYLLYCEY
jgi:hypothetical protein